MSDNLTKHYLPPNIIAALADWQNRATIAVIANRKGGTGKTTLATFISEGLALMAGKKVLVIDTDRQCNISNAFGLSESMSVQKEAALSLTGSQTAENFIPPIHPDFEEGDNFAERSSSAVVMNGGNVLPYDTFVDGNIDYMNVLNPLKGRIDVLPADGEELQKIHSNCIDYDTRTLYVRWATWLVESNVLKEYDMVIYDTPPFDTSLHEALFTLADHTIVPVGTCSDTLSAANAIALTIMGSQGFDTRPRNITTVVNLPNYRLSAKDKARLEVTIWRNQFLGAMPEGFEFPRSSKVSERRTSTIRPHDENYMGRLSDEDRIAAEKQVVKLNRELLVWQQPKLPLRIQVVKIVDLLCEKLFGHKLPTDPFAKSYKPKSEKPKATSTKAKAVPQLKVVG